MNDDDTGIVIFIGIGVLVLATVVFFGVRSSRKKRVSDVPTWSVQTHWIGHQPLLSSSNLEIHGKRQEELFRIRHAIGTAAPAITFSEHLGDTVPQKLRISRVGRSLRSGWPNAKIGFTAYFESWKNVEFPLTFFIKASNNATSITLDTDGVTALCTAGQMVWSTPWNRLLFSNGPDMVLSDGAAKTLRFEYPKDNPELEEILIKYGTLKQMHF